MERRQAERVDEGAALRARREGERKEVLTGTNDLLCGDHELIRRLRLNRYTANPATSAAITV
jgi:hypothetical protein